MPSPSRMPRTWPSRPGARRLPYWFCRRERTRGVGSFDDLVDAGKHHRRDFETEVSGSLQVDSQFELGRLHDWKIGRLLPLQNAAKFIRIGTIAQQLPSHDCDAITGDRG